nr:DUF3626 domain-containing protein [Amycolatopsis sp. WAC 04197]
MAPHFRPDRSTVDGRPLLEAMAEDGYYRNRFGGTDDNAPAAERAKCGR